jgi:peroxiredoxin Q/BCP
MHTIPVAPLTAGFIPMFIGRLFSAPKTALAPGSHAPDFTLPSQEGRLVRLADFRGQWLVLYFYPKDQTPGCTIEAQKFEFDHSKYRQRNAAIVGVSVDTVASHQKFCRRQGLNFDLLADEGGKVSGLYGALVNLGVAKFAARHTFLIDPEGKIARIYRGVSVGRHSAELLADLDLLQKKIA